VIVNSFVLGDIVGREVAVFSESSKSIMEGAK
jgi:hypothetical protein